MIICKNSCGETYFGINPITDLWLTPAHEVCDARVYTAPPLFIGRKMSKTQSQFKQGAFSQWKPEAWGVMPWPLGKQHLMSLRECDQLRSYTSHLVEIIWVAWRPLEKHSLRVMKSWGRIRIIATLEAPSPRVATLESSAPRIAMLEISSSRNVRIIKSCLIFF